MPNQIITDALTQQPAMEADFDAQSQANSETEHSPNPFRTKSLELAPGREFQRHILDPLQSADLPITDMSQLIEPYGHDKVRYAAHGVVARMIYYLPIAPGAKSILEPSIDNLTEDLHEKRIAKLPQSIVIAEGRLAPDTAMYSLTQRVGNLATGTFMELQPRTVVVGNEEFIESTRIPRLGTEREPKGTGTTLVSSDLPELFGIVVDASTGETSYREMDDTTYAGLKSKDLYLLQFLTLNPDVSITLSGTHTAPSEIADLLSPSICVLHTSSPVEAASFHPPSALEVEPPTHDMSLFAASEQDLHSPTQNGSAALPQEMQAVEYEPVQTVASTTTKSIDVKTLLERAPDAGSIVLPKASPTGSRLGRTLLGKITRS